MRIRAAADAFLNELKGRRASSSLVRQTQRTLARLASHLRANRVRELRQVEERHLASFARTLRDSTTPGGTPLSLATQASYLQRVRSFFGFAERRGWILRSPAAEITIPSSSPIPRTVLNVSQAARLMDSPRADTKAGRRDRAVLELLYGTGLRRGECVRLDVSDIDFEERTLLVRDGKGHKDRMVPLTGRAADALNAYLREVRHELVMDPRERALFLTAWWGHRLSDQDLALLVRRHARSADLGRLHPHALRHTCATHLLRGGADVRHVQALLGHKKLDTTSLYTRVVVEDLREVLARAHPRERSDAAKRTG